MNYKEALNNNHDIIQNKSIKTYGIILLAFVASGLAFLATAGFMSNAQI